MKKFFILILTCAIANILPAADFSFSAGAGATAGYLFTRYRLTADGQIDGEPVNVDMGQQMDQFNYGAFLFADGTWVKFSVGIQGGLGSYKETQFVEVDNPDVDEIVSTYKGKGFETMLTLALVGKYPFVTPSEKITWFPLVGIEYQIALMQARQPEGRERRNRDDPIRGETDADGDRFDISVWNSLFVVVGAGMDYDLTSSLFLRTELQYSFRLQTPYEVDRLKFAKKMINSDNPKLGGLTSGPSIKIAAGWRFK